MLAMLRTLGPHNSAVRAGACATGVLTLVLSLLGCGAAARGRATVARSTVEDVDLRRCHDFMAALVTDSAESAEGDFDARVRAQLPPPLLRAEWQAIQTKHGALSSWRVASRDSRFGKDRFTLELQLADRITYALVVFEPAGKIVGLFFSDGPRHEERPVEVPNPRVKEIVVTVGPVDLPGTLTLPDAAEKGPVPGVVLIAGSGPNDRDETVLNAKPFRDLSVGLAARGIAALRYDKRTFAHPELFNDQTSTVEDEVIVDAVAALGVLRDRPEIDLQRIFVVGHSLGALLTPEIAHRAGGVAGLVLLAAPGRPLPEIMLEQLLNRGAKASDVALLAARVKALPHLAGTESVLGMPASYWQDLEKRDELTIARDLRRPVLLLRGAMDRNVAAIDQEHWVNALSGRVPVQAATLPGLNHLFLRNDSSEAARAHVPEEVSSRIADFIDLASLGRAMIAAP